MYSSNNRPNNFNDYDYISSPRQQQNQQNARGPIDSYYFTSQNPKNKKQYGMYSRRYLPKENLSTISRSRVSQNMSTTYNMGFLPQEKLYSEEMLFLLSEQQNNLKYFKQKIEGQKQRVARDFDNLKKQVQHILEDLQISFIAELDLIYKDFINRYKIFKQHMVNLKQIRRSLMNEIAPTQNDYLAQLNHSKTNTISNRDLLNEIQKDAQIFRTQKIYSQIADLQKQNIVPAKQLSNQIILLGGIQTQYYNQNLSNEMMRGLVDILNKQIKQIYPQIHDNYVYSAEYIVNQNGNKNQNILNNLSQYQKFQNNNQQQRFDFKSADHKDIIKSFHTNNSIKKPELKPFQNIQKNEKDNKKYVRPISSSSDFHNIGNISRQNKPVKDDFAPTTKVSRNYHMGNLKNQTNSNFSVGIEQQNVISEWIEDISLREVGQIDAYQNNQAMLCGIFVSQGKLIAIGGKDKILRIYQVSSGKLLYSLSGHQANIVSLANHGQYISSGGDHGCSSLIIWDTKSWNIRNKVQLHTAAVTCIVDLQDSTNLATASYDKKINIFSYRKGGIILTVNSIKIGIGCMSLTSDKHRLISSGLDNSIMVWKIGRQGTNIINLDLQKQFMNDYLTCSLRTFTLKSNYFMIGTKQGKIQIINCLTGQTIRKISVGTGPIVQILLFQRENKIQTPIAIICSAKQKSLILAKTQTGMNSLIDVKGKLNIQFGCGISPKIIVSQSGCLGIVSQSPSLKQILIYQIGLL